MQCTRRTKLGNRWLFNHYTILSPCSPISLSRDFNFSAVFNIFIKNCSTSNWKAASGSQQPHNLSIPRPKFKPPGHITSSYLCELRLPVGFGSLITVAPGNLEVAIQAAHHQQLFKLKTGHVTTHLVMSQHIWSHHKTFVYVTTHLVMSQQNLVMPQHIWSCNKSLKMLLTLEHSWSCHNTFGPVTTHLTHVASNFCSQVK